MRVAYVFGQLWRLAFAEVLLAFAFWLLMPLVLLMLLPLVVIGNFDPRNLAWLVLLAGFMIYGLRKRQPAYVLAPVLFFAVWYGISVQMRRQVAAIESAGNFMPPIPAGTSAYRTLIIDDFYGNGIRLHPLANGAVDRIVKVIRDEQSKAIRVIDETTLGRGEECTAQDRNRSHDLLAVGRIDECYRWRLMEAVPDDGLVISYRYNVAIVHGRTGCCNEIAVSRRQQGREEPLFVWQQGYAHVLSYQPIFAGAGAFMGSVQPGIWEQGAAPWQVVRYGAPDIERETMVAAIYGVDATKPPKAPALAPEDLMARAEQLSRGSSADRNAVVPLLIKMKKEGPVDDRWIRLAATLIGRDSYITRVEELTNLTLDLTVAQRIALYEYAWERIQTPGLCTDCPGSETPWSFLRRAPNSRRYAEQGRAVFEDRSDLSMWQYEAALRITLHDGPSPYDAKASADLRAKLFRSVATDDSAAFGPRAIAFRRVFRLPDKAERAIAVQKLDRIADTQLDEFIRSFWGVSDLLEKTPEMTSQIEALCGRIGLIADARVAATIRTHGRVPCRTAGTN